jgi:hypothetical protein
MSTEISPDGDFVAAAAQMYVSSAAPGTVFQDIYLRKFAGRDYLVGKVRTFKDDGRDGLETWCNIEAVSMWIKFPDIESARRFIDNWEDEREKHRWQS